MSPWMLGAHMIPPEWTWGAPSDGGCWALLAAVIPADRTDARSVLRPFSDMCRAADFPVDDALAAAFAGAKPGDWIGRPDTHSIARTLVRRVSVAYAELRWLAGLAINREIGRIAFLWRAYIECHLDLAVELADAPTSDATSDAVLTQRTQPAWPSRYEMLYPWGTRCYWAGYSPRIAHIVQAFPWLVKSQINKKLPLRQIIQKACAGKGLTRRWPKIIALYCAVNADVAAVSICAVRCCVFGLYPSEMTGIDFPAPDIALHIWRGFAREPERTITMLARESPKLLLCAWQEFVVWLFGALEPMQTMMSLACDLDQFSVEVCTRVRTCVRGALAAGGPDAMQTVETLAGRSFAQPQSSLRRPTNRPSFASLVCRAVNTRIRDKEAGAVASPSSARAIMQAGAERAVGAGAVAPWHAAPRDIDDAMAVAGVPQHIVATVRWLSRAHAAHAVTDNSVKLSMNKTLAAADVGCLRAMRACIASATFASVVTLLPLSAATLAAQLRVVPPERRFVYVCPSCSVVGATHVVTNKRTGKPEIVRGLRFVSYGSQTDTITCRKLVMSPRAITATIHVSPNAIHAAGLAAVRRADEAVASAALPPPPPAMFDHGSARRTKTSCGARMITVPSIGYMLSIRGVPYASCEQCGVYALLDRDRWCTDGRILCPMHAAAVSVASAPPVQRRGKPRPTVSSTGASCQTALARLRTEPCIICSRRATNNTLSQRAVVRIYFDMGVNRRVALAVCCRRHFADQIRDGRLPRLLRESVLWAEQCAFASALDAKRNPYHRKPTTRRQYLNAMAVGTTTAADRRGRDYSGKPAKKRKAPAIAPLSRRVRTEMSAVGDAIPISALRIASPRMPARPRAVPPESAAPPAIGKPPPRVRRRHTADAPHKHRHHHPGCKHWPEIIAARALLSTYCLKK
ncbi:MAG: hypothetical protein WC732_09015 [Candidatus Omnitrophota bacterium]